MKQREKTMALVLIGLMTLVFAALIYFQYYARTMSSLDRNLAKIDDDELRERNNWFDLQEKLPRLEQARKLSLPLDLEFSKREYALKLEDLLRKSEFYATTPPTISPKPQENVSNLAAAKRPPYTKLTYDIRASGELSNLIEFLDRFYRTPLLHRIKSLTITRPLTGQRGSDLDITMVIEALILEGAEKRTTLLPELSGKDIPKVSAREPTQYAMIAGNNIFFGPYEKPAPVSTVPQAPPRNPAFLSEIRLNAIYHDENGTRAEMYDEYHQYQYIMRKRADGSYRADSYYMLKDRRKPLSIGERILEIQDEHGEIYHKFNIVRIDIGDVFLEENDKLYRLHIGEMLASRQKLTDEEIKKYGLPGKEKKDNKAAEKKEPGKPETAVQTDAAKDDSKVTPVKKEDKPEPEKKANTKGDGK